MNQNKPSCIEITNTLNQQSLDRLAEIHDAIIHAGYTGVFLTHIEGLLPIADFDETTPEGFIYVTCINQLRRYPDRPPTSANALELIKRIIDARQNHAK